MMHSKIINHESFKPIYWGVVQNFKIHVFKDFYIQILFSEMAYCNGCFLEEEHETAKSRKLFCCSSVRDFVHLSVILSICPWFRPYVCNSVHLSVILSISLWFCPSVCDFVHLSVIASICLWFRPSSSWSFNVLWTLFLFWTVVFYWYCKPFSYILHTTYINNSVVCYSNGPRFLWGGITAGFTSLQWKHPACRGTNHEA